MKKRFSQLTSSQKEEAVQLVLNSLKEAISDGFIVYNRNVTPMDLLDDAAVAAEEGIYEVKDGKITFNGSEQL